MRYSQSALTLLRCSITRIRKRYATWTNITEMSRKGQEPSHSQDRGLPSTCEHFASREAQCQSSGKYSQDRKKKSGHLKTPVIIQGDTYRAAHSLRYPQTKMDKIICPGWHGLIISSIPDYPGVLGENLLACLSRFMCCFVLCSGCLMPVFRRC